MTVASEQIEAVAREEAEATADFLMETIRHPSTSGKEQSVMEMIEKAFQPLADKVERIPFPKDFINDPEYSFPIEGVEYEGRWNLRVVLGDDAQDTPSLIFNTHTDVVPASENQPRAFDPYRENGTIFGRGACDDKGGVATMYLMLRIFKRLGIKPRTKLVFHLVNEEENGGNGTLGMIRTNEKADAVVVLEPSGGKIISSVRRAVWFRVRLSGLAGHVASAGKTVSALKNAIEAVGLLEGFHAETLADSQGLPLYDKYPNPMPINFGRLQAGVWPASAPNQAVLEGVMGFLQNRTRQQIMEGMERVLREKGSKNLKDNFSLEFMYRHDAHVCDPEHKLVKSMQTAAQTAGLPGELDAFTASCDSWFYNNLLDLPTVVFGPGHIAFAHGAEEQIEVDEIREAAQALAQFSLDWQ